MTNLLIVIIIYRTKFNESASVKSLSLPFAHNDINIKIVLYDNSPYPQQFDTNDLFECEYVHNPLNGGLTEAYNYALSLVSEKKSWLLLLDQDSQLPEDFIATLLTTIKEVDDESVVAVAPLILCDNNVVSPCKVKLAGRLTSVSEQFTGASDSELMAINSGMAVRASFLKQIGGFNQEFWLDYLDHWLCWTIYAEGKKIFVSPSIVHHSLSVSNYNEVSEKRALNILNAEVLFYSKYKSEFERTAYFFRLCARSIKQLIKLKNKKIAGYTLKSAISLLGK